MSAIQSVTESKSEGTQIRTRSAYLSITLLKKMKTKIFIIYFCGLWSFGLGLRMTLELLISDTGIYVPKHYLNIYFDFLPLCIFGLVVSILSIKDIIKDVKKEK